MIAGIKEAIKRRWPRMRLRTIVFATLFTVAALPGIAAMFLRVYENTLVRQTEAELVAQGAALAATAQALWPGARPQAVEEDAVHPEPPTIDLSSTPILPDRPAPATTGQSPSPEAVAALARLAPILARTKQTTLSSILLLDRQGRIVAGPDRGSSYAALPEVRSALSGKPRTVLRRNAAYCAVYRFEWLSRAAAVRVDHARPVVVNGHVVGVLLLSRSARSLFKGLYEDRGKILIGIFGILAILIVLSGVLSRGIVRPIEALGRATRTLASGRGTIPETPQTAAVEIQGLYADFSRMATAIDRRSRYLRDFAHAMSHEFKTPLTGIRGALEILSDHADEMSAEERRRFLDNADADAARLSLLVSRLLDLARADMSPVDPDVATDLRAVLCRLADTHSDDTLRVVFDLPDDTGPVLIPEASLDAVLSTFIGNSRQAGANIIRFEGQSERNLFVLRISDNGSGVAAADRERIFEPFFTTHRSNGGSGLGLAIARSLLGASDGEVSLVVSETGAVFEVKLPTFLA